MAYAGFERAHSGKHPVRSSPISDCAPLRTPSSSELAIESACLAEDLARISERLGGIRRQIGPISDTSPADRLARTELVNVVRAMIAERLRRFRFFPSDLFADPAWDILLDLYLAELEQRRTMVSSLCIASCVPATTALRWIKTLNDQGFLTRRADPLDARRTYIGLTEGASRAMQNFMMTPAPNAGT